MNGPRSVGLRLLIYGLWKCGKTRIALTFPAPLLIHPIVETGFDTAFYQGRYLAQPVALGQTHAAKLRGQGGVSIRKELDTWIEWLHTTALQGQCPYQTVAIGGFSDMLRMIQAEEEADPKNRTRGGELSIQWVWQGVLRWTLRTTQLLFALPQHVILEVGAKGLFEDMKNPMAVTRYVPDLQGQTKSIVQREASVIAYQERSLAGSFRTHFRESGMFFAESRLHDLKVGAVDNCGYDFFAQQLGLPPIWEADPKHPRCQPGCWPWNCEWHA